MWQRHPVTLREREWQREPQRLIKRIGIHFSVFFRLPVNDCVGLRDAQPLPLRICYPLRHAIGYGVSLPQRIPYSHGLHLRLWINNRIGMRKHQRLCERCALL